MRTPSAPRSTISCERPAWRSPASASGVVRQSTTAKWLRCAFVVQTFVPVTRQPPSTRVAVVRTDARSEPASGSLMPRENQHSPAAIRGRNQRRCSSVPKRSRAGAVWRSAIQCAAIGAPAASSSSTTTKRRTVLAPAPPYSTGMDMPTQPCAASARVNSGSWRPPRPRPGRKSAGRIPARKPRTSSRSASSPATARTERRSSVGLPGWRAVALPPCPTGRAAASAGDQARAPGSPSGMTTLVAVRAGAPRVDTVSTTWKSARHSRGVTTLRT